ncbi:MAG: DUF4270 domain-containing protein [Draconibacterium sp.]|nr:DUF4270 domain-containing protein [Draconibacterium sp.]
MKSNYKNQFLSIIMLMLIALTGCKEQSSIGVEVLPAGDLITVRSTTQAEILSFTHSEDSIRTDEASKSLLGSFTDSLFGNTTIGFAAQFRLYEFPDFGKNPKADSVKLYLYYRIIYGDTVTKQKFNVYELSSPLNVDSRYTQNTDLKGMSSGNLIGQLEYKPKIKQDSTTRDTFYQLINIPIDIALGEKLINADSMQMINTDVFLEYFKGLYIETEKQIGRGGAILSLEAVQQGSFNGSALVLFYSNDSAKSAAGGDTSLIMPYIISTYSARVNNIQHDYTETPFYQNLNSETVQDSLMYVQATGGLKARILIEELSSWRDSVNIAINKAELIFQIDTIASQVKKFPPPLQMLFTVVDSLGKEFLPKDYVFNPSFYGGGLRKDYTYHFNITQHVQEVIDGNAKNLGFFLTPAQKNNQANRVVLKGSTSKTGIKLIITYSIYTE